MAFFAAISLVLNTFIVIILFQTNTAYSLPACNDPGPDGTRVAIDNSRESVATLNNFLSVVFTSNPNEILTFIPTAHSAVEASINALDTLSCINGNDFADKITTLLDTFQDMANNLSFAQTFFSGLHDVNREDLSPGLAALAKIADTECQVVLAQLGEVLVEASSAEGLTNSIDTSLSTSSVC
jgi:hypothetical protein